MERGQIARHDELPFAIRLRLAVLILSRKSVTEHMNSKIEHDTNSSGGRFLQDEPVCEDFLVGSGEASILFETRTAISRSDEHTSELQSLMRTSHAVFCL